MCINPDTRASSLRALAQLASPPARHGTSNSCQPLPRAHAKISESTHTLGVRIFVVIDSQSHHFVSGVEARADALLCHHPDIHAICHPYSGEPYLTREELDHPNCPWEFRLKAPCNEHAFATLLVPLAQPFTGGDLTVFPFDPLGQCSGDDADFKTKFVPLHPASSGSPVYAASFNAPDRIALHPVKSGARVLLV
jgi:hypothetical protein